MAVLLFLLFAAACRAATLSLEGACATVTLESPSASAALVLLSDGRALGACAAGARRCSASLPAGALWVTAYELGADGALALVAAERLGSSLGRGAPCAGSRPAAAAARPSVGILYEGWHAPPVAAQANVSARGGALLTVEDVLRSRGARALRDVWAAYPGAEAIAAGFYFQARPAAGFYCIYRRRPGEAGVAPDCAGVAGTLARHAAELSGAGVDYVTLDGTNLGSFSAFADEIQVRPGEVVFEEWAALRARGAATPAVAAWQTVPAGSDLWARWLALYNNETLGALVARDAATGKKLFFVPPNGDAGIIAAIEDNGGRRDVIVQQMWALNALEAAGQWSFFAPCTERGAYTTSVVGAGRGASGCAQRASNASGPLARVAGAQAAVSPSYQMGYGSLPFEGANKYGALTFKRQFATLLDGARAGWAAGARAGLPAHIYVSSYNEWTAQPQKNPFPPGFTHSLGLAADADGGELWVDSYGQSVSRDIEASADEGDGVYQVMASCLRVVALAAALDAAVFEGGGGGGGGGALAPATDSLWRGQGARARALAALRAAFGGGAEGLAACAVAGEACCAFNATLDAYAPVWALRLAAADDALLSANASEVAALVAAGWRESCNAYDGPTDFCVDAAAAASAAALHGPLALHAGGCDAPGRAPLARCFDGARHFVSRDAACAGATADGVLGCVATAPTSNMARVLRACTAAPPRGMRYHVLDGPCDAGDADGGELGFVR
jgi:hypothetical protein